MAISASGVVLLTEIARALRSNLFSIDRSLATEPRFLFCVWTAVVVGFLFSVKGVTVLLSRSINGAAFTWVEGPLTIAAAVLLITVVNRWRIISDVAPPDPIRSTDGLPLVLRVIANPWTSYSVVAAVAGVLAVMFWAVLRRVAPFQQGRSG